jgi:stalled ribosome rescue protein Dom34
MSVETPRPGKRGSVELKVNSRQDYQFLAMIIERNDTIQLKIPMKIGRGRGDRAKQVVEHPTATLTVEQVISDRDSLSVTGSYSCTLGGGRTRCWLTDGEGFCLTKPCWTLDHIHALAALFESRNSISLLPSSAENTIVQGKTIAEFKQLLITKADMITYGPRYVFCAADAGAVRSLILTNAVFQEQSMEKRKALSHPSQKFKGADVFIIGNSSPLSMEITGYGGAAAILRYAFDPAACM